MMNRLNIFLAVLLLVVVGMTSLVGVDYSRPNIEILPDMKYTPAWEAFAANPNFPDGRTMQAPVPGTIARGHLPLHFAPTKEDAIRAGEILDNPFAVSTIETVVAAEPVEPVAADAHPAASAMLTPEAAEPLEAMRRAAIVRERFAASVARGAAVYRVFCVACHGAKGAGDGLVTQRGFPPPPSLLTGKSVQMKDGRLFHILTYGQGSMAPFAGQLARDQRWDVINYVRQLQGAAAPTADVVTPTAEGTTAVEGRDSQPPKSKLTP